MDTLFSIFPLTAADRSWVASFLEEHWGASVVITRGVLHPADRLPGFCARQDGQVIGLVTYQIAGKGCEIISLDSLAQGIGAGSALIRAVQEVAVSAGCERLWLITTNDNTPALRFYQKRGFRLAALHPQAVDRARLLKPSIPLTGIDGIEIHDEVELEIKL